MVTTRRYCGDVTLVAHRRRWPAALVPRTSPVPRAYVLGPHSARSWLADFAAGRVATRMPYAAEHLADAGFEVEYSSPYDVAWLWRSDRLLQPLGGRLQKWFGRPVLEPWLALVQARRPDVFISFFEDNAQALGQALRWAPWLRPRTTVLVVCWLAERCQLASAKERREMLAHLQKFDRLVVFSSNQVRVLRELGVDEHRISVARLGVAAPPEAAGRTLSAEGGPAPWALSVGSDAGRDYVTLAAALRRTDVPCLVGAPAASVEHLVMPVGFRWLGLVDAERFHELMRASSFVVVPSRPLAYPTGQSLLLAAMAAGKACIVSDSPAIRDYVSDEVAVLIPAGNAEALAEAMTRLAADPARCRRLGAAARRHWEASFTPTSMWSDIAALLPDRDAMSRAAGR